MQKDIWTLQNKAQNLLPDEPVTHCMRQIDQQRFYDKSVNITYSSVEKQAYYGHLKICGSAWHCPVCASIIVRYRRNELTEALRDWKGKGGKVLLATFTVSHQKGTALATLLSPLEATVKHVRGGRAAQRIKVDFGIHGTISTREVKYTEHGWCPCIHQFVLFDEKHKDFFSQDDPSFEEYFQLLSDPHNEESTGSAYGDVLQSRWRQMINVEGRTDNEFRVSIEEDFKNIYDYAEQFGDELLDDQPMHTINSIAHKGDSIELTPFAVLNLAARGASEFEALFHEYAECYKGKRLVVWSKDLRSTVGLSTGISEYSKGKSDYDVVYEEINQSSNKIMILTQEQWENVQAKKKREELIEIANSGSWMAIVSYLATLGEEASG